MNANLVMDIRGARDASKTAVQVYTRKPTSTPAEIEAAKNQYWTLVAPQVTGTAVACVFIQSLWDANLVLDIVGAKDAAGTALQVFTKKHTNTAELFNAAANQLWRQIGAPAPDAQ